MHVPKLCKMHNQAFKYTPCEWPMCMHGHVRVHEYCTCMSVSHRYTHTHTHKMLTTVKPQGITLMYSYKFILTVYTSQSPLYYSLKLHCNRHLCNVKLPQWYITVNPIVVAELSAVARWRNQSWRNLRREGFPHHIYISSFHPSILLSSSRCRL